MSDNNSGRSAWRPSYANGRKRRVYLEKNGLDRKMIYYIGGGILLVVLLIVILLLSGGRNDPTTLPSTRNATARPGVSASKLPATTDSLAFAVTTPTSAPTPTPVPTPTPTPAPTKSPEGPMVWDTANGSYFHFNEKCQGMSGATQESMRKAYESGKQPCDRCVTNDAAIAARDNMTVRVLTGLPSEMGNVVIQDPEVVAITVVETTPGKFNDKPALLVTCAVEGDVAMLFTNQPDMYDVRVYVQLTDKTGKIVASKDDEPLSYPYVGLAMKRDVRVVCEVPSLELEGMELTVIVYAKEGFANIDCDTAVLGMYKQKLG